MGRPATEVLVCLLVSAGPSCRAGNLPTTLPAAVQPRGIGSGDELEIRVAHQEQLSGPFQVDDEGKVRFPWLGPLDARGRTTSELAAEIETRLRDGYLREPQVSVRILARQNREVSVLGEVKQPGSYPYKERLTLVQAISLAGGLSPLALERKVRLIRETDRGRETFEIDVRQILDRGREDLPLEPGDIVFVPDSPI
jgi:polysaccharide export outer membrane protein